MLERVLNLFHNLFQNLLYIFSIDVTFGKLEVAISVSFVRNISNTSLSLTKLTRSAVRQIVIQPYYQQKVCGNSLFPYNTFYLFSPSFTPFGPPQLHTVHHSILIKHLLFGFRIQNFKNCWGKRISLVFYELIMLQSNMRSLLDCPLCEGMPALQPSFSYHIPPYMTIRSCARNRYLAILFDTMCIKFVSFITKIRDFRLCFGRFVLTGI